MEFSFFRIEPRWDKSRLYRTRTSKNHSCLSYFIRQAALWGTAVRCSIPCPEKKEAQKKSLQILGRDLSARRFNAKIEFIPFMIFLSNTFFYGAHFIERKLESDCSWPKPPPPSSGSLPRSSFYPDSPRLSMKSFGLNALPMYGETQRWPRHRSSPPFYSV